MTRSEIKNLNDLNDYLSLLEDRIADLENQDQVIKSAINDVNQDLQETVNIDDILPRTGLLSRKFFTCA